MSEVSARASQAAGPDAEAIAAAVDQVPSVAGLHSGAFGEVATYLPGRRVRGVRLSDEAAAVHVTGRYPTPIPVIAEAVRAAAAPHVAGLPVTVSIEDLALPGEEAEDTGPAHEADAAPTPATTKESP